MALQFAPEKLVILKALLVLYASAADQVALSQLKRMFLRPETASVELRVRVVAAAVVYAAPAFIEMVFETGADASYTMVSETAVEVASALFMN